MKKSLFLASALLVALASCKKPTEDAKKETSEPIENEVTTQESTSYKINTTESVINWKGAKVFVKDYAHTGTLKLKSGELKLASDKSIVDGSFVIDMTTITNSDLEDTEKKEMLEAHLKGTAEEKKDHFFNVSEFPEATFEITGIEGSIVKGNLTIKGNTNEEEFEATISEENGQLIAQTSAFKINRVKYKVEYGSKTTFADIAKDNVISDDIELEIKLVLEK